MARSYFKRQRGRAIKRYFGKGYNPKVGTIAKDVSWLKSVVNVEKKYVDTNSNGTTLVASPGGTLVLLNGIAQGDTQSTREGISCKGMYLYVEGFMILNATAPAHDICRIGFILDKQPNGAAAVYSNIFDAASTGPIARRNPGNGFRFKILSERTVTLSSSGQTLVKFSMYKKLNFHTRYNPASNAGTIADINTNALYLYFSGNLSATMSTINYAVRYRYVDN